MTTYSEHPPHPALSAHVRCVWELRTPDAPTPAGTFERVLPDGCFEWIFHFATPFELVNERGSRARQGAALFAGATTRAVCLVPSRAADVLGVRFEPGGVSGFQRQAAERFEGRIGALEEFELPWVTELCERLFDAPRAARPALVQRVLLEHLVRETAEAARVRGAVELLLHGGASVAQVAERCGMGPRRLQRGFRARVGIAPKELARIARFQRVLGDLGDPGLSLAALACAHGYADQAHLGREFRALAGLSPARWRRAAHPLADAFVVGN